MKDEVGGETEKGWGAQVRVAEKRAAAVGAAPLVPLAPVPLPPLPANLCGGDVSPVQMAWAPSRYAGWQRQTGCALQARQLAGSLRHSNSQPLGHRGSRW